ncbi:MAG TPA: hypothetical protein VN033_07220 [Vulgatibacter sp.]|nr:hypothetical protein [Vulgatibacter sp.]
MDPAAWLEAARDRYLQLRGSGLVLSPMDADRLRAWRDRGLPLDVVLRGLELAHAAWLGAGRANASRPFPLWAAERHVEALARGWERRAPSGASRAAAAPPSPTPGPLDRDLLSSGPLARTIEAVARLAGVGAGEGRSAAAGGESPGAAARSPIAAAYGAALRVLLRAEAGGGDESRSLLRADEAAGIAYLVALPRHEQADVVSETMRRAGPRGASTRARHRAMLRAVLAEAAFRHGGFERPSDL